MLKQDDVAVIKELQGDIPVSATPYAEIAARLGIGEEELLDRLRSYVRRGWLRRIGAILHHQRAGIAANAMCAWRVPEERIVEVGRAMAAHRAVSHCYQRPPMPGWPYNLYTMVHGATRKECEAIVERMRRETGVDECSLLFTAREFKKTSMNYF